MSFILNFLKRFRSKKKEMRKLPKAEAATKKPSQKYITTMINSLTLSSDMETLYLIDNGRSISFPLNSKMGVLIGTLNGQITVASSHQSPEETDLTEEGPTEEGPDKPTVPGIAKAAAVPKLVRLATPNSQYTAFYNKKFGVLGFMGATDIDINFKQVGGEAPAVMHLFDMNNSVVNIRKKNNNIEIFSTRRR